MVQCNGAAGHFASNPQNKLANELSANAADLSLWTTASGFTQRFAFPSDLRLQCRDIDQPVAALIRDLKQRGLLDETLLHQMGIDHTRLTYRFQGRDFRLTDVHGRVVNEILS